MSVRMTSLLFLLGEERYRQPRAVHKHSAPCRLCCVEIFFTVSNGYWFCHPRGTLLVLEAITLVHLIPLMGVRALPCGLDYDQFPLRLSCGDGFSDVLAAYGSLCWQPLFPSRRLKSTVMWSQRQERTVQTVPGPARGGPTGAVLGYVIDMPVVVHVKVVDIPFVAQRQIPLVQTTEIPQLQSIDKVVVVCAGPAVRTQLWETVEIPQLQPVSWTWSLTCPLVCNNRCWVLIVLGRALCTGTGPGFDPAIRRGRGGGDAGSLLPGVLPPEFFCMLIGVNGETHMSYNIVCTTTTTTTTTPTTTTTNRLVTLVLHVSCSIFHGWV